MREIEITDECIRFVNSQSEKFSVKFFQLLEVMIEVQVVNSKFIKKLQSTEFYELRIKSNNEYRIIIFAIDHENFIECKQAVCLCGFQKKATKDYKRELQKAQKILMEYLNEE